MNSFDPPQRPAPPAIPTEGKVVSWEDNKGFGWIECNGRRLFAHIKDFERGQRRPAKGEMVTFVSGFDERGRPCAKGIRFVRQGGRVGGGSWIILSLLLILPLLSLLRLPFPWWMGATWFVVASLITYALYASDKGRAQPGKWRIPESQLHLAELLGGWPGAWIAQRRLRHKVVKASYQAYFWIILIGFQIVSADLLMEGRGLRWMIACLQDWSARQ